MQEEDEPVVEEPGFEAIFAIIGLVSVTLLLRRRKGRFE
ncbi:MAG TPA: PGF-CTERM sorting domain-containing protein [Methanosarcinaceae archaeon]|nr:PGF-CTERM sorting domain-containing protein [Methanosarcinaceae archaeon]